LSEDNPVRAIDVFVDELDLARLGFSGIEPEATGRPAYHPSTLLKIYVYKAGKTQIAGFAGRGVHVTSRPGSSRRYAGCRKFEIGREIEDHLPRMLNLVPRRLRASLFNRLEAQSAGLSSRD
jgi:hypothetical protein